MKTEYYLNSAQELKPEILESIKLAFGESPIRITIESNAKSNTKLGGSKDSKYPKELTDTVIDLIFDQLSKRKK